MAGALKSPVIAGLARCAHGLTSVPMHIVADMRIAAAKSVGLSQHGPREASTIASGIST